MVYLSGSRLPAKDTRLRRSRPLVKPFPNITLESGSVAADGHLVLAGVADATSAADPNGVGAFLVFKAEKPAARLVFDLGRLEGVSRWTVTHRYDPFWMSPKAGV